MTISYVSGATAEANTLTMPSHEKGDLLVMFAYRSLSAVAPTVPAGWSVLSGRAGTVGYVIAAKYAASSTETSGTWTNAEALACVIYRDSVNLLVVGAVNASAANNTTISYPAIPSTITTAVVLMRSRSVDAYVLGFVGVPSNSSANAGDSPTGMTNRLNLVGSGARQIAIHDTGNVASWAAQTVTQGSANVWVTSTVEIFDSGCPKSIGSGRLIGPSSLISLGA